VRIIFLGTRRLGYLGLKAIIESGRHEVVCVVTEDYEITEGYNHVRFKELCATHNVPSYKTDRINNKNFAEVFKKLNPDIGVSLYWRRLIKKPIIDIPRYGFINAHGSDLPRYRGFASTSWAILLGDKQAAITVHRVVDGEADTGHIMKKKYVPITEVTTIADLQQELFTAAIDLTIEVLDEFASGNVMPKPQDESQTIISYPRLPRDGEVDWSKSADQIDRLIRAVSKPYPGAFTYYKNIETGEIKKLYVWKAHVLKNCPKYVGVPGHVIKNIPGTGQSWILTGDGILVLEEVQFEGETPLTPSSVWKSVQVRLGLEIQEEIMLLHRRLGELEEKLKGP
jgi:methionyl-tRNA formyltransferase